MAKNPFVTPDAPATEPAAAKPSFSFDPTAIAQAPEGYSPPRQGGPGRKPSPSPFEPVLRDYVGADWQNYPHDGKVVFEDGKPTVESLKASNASVILRELRKARQALSLGLRTAVTDKYVSFKVTAEPKKGGRPKAAVANTGE